LDADTSGQDDGHVDPIRTFADRLRRLQVDSGGPSVRDLVRLTDKVGSPYSRGTIQDKLAGRSASPWEFVEAFVRSCALHTGANGEPDLRPWRDWHAQMAREVAARRAGPRSVLRADVCPYRGLEAFTADEAEWFHGRGAAVQSVLAGLAAYRRGVVLLGPSGAGKSSVVQAGVLPALATGQLPGSDQWVTVLVRPGKDLLAELDRAGLAEAHSRPIGAAAAERLASAPTGSRVLLIVDQFEELLTPGGSDVQTAAQRGAIDALTAAIGSPGLSVVLVLRDDFYPRLASQAPELLQALIAGLINVPATLNTEDLRAIITRPAASVGLESEAGLPERIITDVLAAESGTEPARQAPITVLPLLELTLQQLWQRRHHGRLTHEAYQRIGGIAGALTTWCDTAIEQLPAEQQPIAQRILTALVRPADELHHIPAVRQQMPLVALRRLASGAHGPSDQGVDEVLGALTEHRIVTTHASRTGGQPDDALGAPVAELVHEALIRAWPTLRDWVGQDHRFQDWLRRADERHTRWADHRTPGDLLHGSDLAEGLDWSAQRGLPDHIAGLLTASRRNQRAGIRRTRIIAAVLAGLLVVALAATGLALRQRQTAIAAQRVGLSRQLAAQSTTLMDAYPDLAMLLAVHAYRASPTSEATASVYTAAAFPLLHRLTSKAEWSVAFSPDGRTLATGGEDGNIGLWDVPGGQPRTPLHDNDAVGPVAFSPDGRTLATGGWDGTIQLWDLPGGHARDTLYGHTDGVEVLAFSPDGRTLASASSDGTVRLWDIPDGQERATFTRRTAGPQAVAFSPDGRMLASGGDDGTVRLWDVPGRRPGAVLTGHQGAVWAVAFSPDGRMLATGGDDHTVRLWDVPGGRSRTILNGHTAAVWAVAFSPDGHTLATGGDDRIARLWDVAAKQLRATLAGHTDQVNSLTFSSNGRTLATAGFNTVRLWDAADGQPQGALPGRGVTAAAFSPDGRMLATSSVDGARLWDVTRGQARAVLTGHTAAVRAVAFSPDGRTLATGGDDRTIRLWDAIGDKPPATLTGHETTVNSVSFSRDGRTLASGSDDFAIRLWDMPQGRPRATLSDKAKSVAFSPDGRTLASGSDSIAVQLWDLTKRVPSTLYAHTAGTVNAVAFSPDGRTLATGGWDRTVRLWDIASRQLRTTLLGHTGAVTAVAFSPDGHTLATSGWDGVRLWNVATGRLRTTLTGHNHRVQAVAFSPDGRILATGSRDLTVRLWDVADGHTRAILVGHTGAVNSLAFSPDGHILATASGDSTVRLWDIALPTLAGAIQKICRVVNRDLTPQERALYLPSDGSATAACP
jgi:WD40 repeat protein